MKDFGTMILELASEPPTTDVGVLTLFKIISSCCPVSSPSNFGVCAETGTVTVFCAYTVLMVLKCAFALLRNTFESCSEVMLFKRIEISSLMATSK